MAALELCSGVFYYFASYYEASKREEVFTKQQGSMCYLQISAAQCVRSFVYGNGNFLKLVRPLCKLCSLGF